MPITKLPSHAERKWACGSSRLFWFDPIWRRGVQLRFWEHCLVDRSLHYHLSIFITTNFVIQAWSRLRSITIRIRRGEIAYIILYCLLETIHIWTALDIYVVSIKWRLTSEPWLAAQWVHPNLWGSRTHDVHKLVSFLDPSPLVLISDWSILLNPRNLPCCCPILINSSVQTSYAHGPLLIFTRVVICSSRSSIIQIKGWDAVQSF